MSSNFVSSMSFTPDFGNVIANSNTGIFVINSNPFQIGGAAEFFDIDFTSIPLNQLWFSLPSDFPCSIGNIEGELRITCPTFAETISNVVISKFDGSNNNYSSWMGFFNVNVLGVSNSCTTRFAFIGKP
jgi:hypothetical protein